MDSLRTLLQPNLIRHLANESLTVRGLHSFCKAGNDRVEKPGYMPLLAPFFKSTFFDLKLFGKEKLARLCELGKQLHPLLLQNQGPGDVLEMKFGQRAMQ